jgi:hypothetical protein
MKLIRETINGKDLSTVNETDLRTVFSLPVLDTQMTWLVFASEYRRKVFVIMALASLHPKKDESSNVKCRTIQIYIFSDFFHGNALHFLRKSRIIIFCFTVTYHVYQIL